MTATSDSKKRGRPAGYSIYPKEWPKEMVLDAYRCLCEGKVSPTSIYLHTGFPSENVCRKVLSNYIFPGRKEMNWVQLSTYVAIKRMQASKEAAEKTPTIFCGECPQFKKDKALTSMPDGRCIRYGTCLESNKKMDRCSKCIYGIYESLENLSEKVGYHIK